MKRIILFRYHKNLKLCKNRLQLLKKFNPEIEIYGLFGGERKDHEVFLKALSPELENSYFIKNISNYWKWKNSDLAISEWYRDFGKKLDFDILHVIEWDLIILKPLEVIYYKNGIWFSALTPLKKVEKRWDWTSKEPEKSEWKRLLEFAKKNYRYKKQPFASLGPGMALPRKFLEEYCKMEIPELVHDELRIPLFAQILGFKLFDTCFVKNWFGKNEDKYFNCIPKEIKLEMIKKELLKLKGRRVFHPYRKILKIN